MDEIKNIYPSPLRRKVKYNEKLVKKREFMGPPKPSLPAFIYDQTASKDYDNEMEEWIENQTKMDADGFSLLAEHYALDVDDPKLYEKLVLHLARDHVPFFSMKNKAIKKGEVNQIDLAILAIQAHIIIKEKGINRSNAIKEMINTNNVTSIKNNVPKGERLFGGENGRKELESRSLEELIGHMKTLKDMKKEVDEFNRKYYE